MESPVNYPLNIYPDKFSFSPYISTSILWLVQKLYQFIVTSILSWVKNIQTYTCRHQLSWCLVLCQTCVMNAQHISHVFLAFNSTKIRLKNRTNVLNHRGRGVFTPVGFVLGVNVHWYMFWGICLQGFVLGVPVLSPQVTAQIYVICSLRVCSTGLLSCLGTTAYQADCE